MRERTHVLKKKTFIYGASSCQTTDIKNLLYWPSSSEVFTKSSDCHGVFAAYVFLVEISNIFFQKWRTQIPKINFTCNTWEISGAKHQNIVRWLGFAPYKTSGRGHLNSVNLVNVRNLEFPVLDIFVSGIKMDQRPGQNVDLGLYFHMEGPRFPKNNANKSIFGRTNLKISKKNF